MEKVKIMDHPLIQHKIGWLRRSSTGSRDFRGIVGEIAMLMCYEATRGLELEDIEVETPICAATVKELKGKKLAIVPILRAGLGMVDEDNLSLSLSLYVSLSLPRVCVFMCVCSLAHRDKRSALGVISQELST